MVNQTEEVLIAYDNLVDNATLSGGSWTSTLPLSNLQVRELEQVARSTSLNPDHTKFVAQYPDDNLISNIALANHNMSLSAQYRVRYTDDPTLTTFDYDSGWMDVWPAPFDSYDLDWGSPNWWSGRYLERDRKAYVWTLIHNLPAAVRPLYWLFEFNDQENVKPYIQIGRLFQAPSWQPQYNMDFGAVIQLETTAEVSLAHSGAEFFNEGITYRVTRFVTRGMTEDEAMSKAFEIQRLSGIDKEVVFMWNPTDTRHAIRRQYLGRLRKLEALEFPQAYVDGQQAVQTAWEVKESVP